MKIAYARTSTVEQENGLTIQLERFASLACDKVFKEKVSSVAERSQLRAAIDYVREGDVFIVTKLDRLARSVADFVNISQELEEKGVTIQILDLNLDTSTPTGKLMLNMLASVAQFERELMLERQREGIAKAKQQGKYTGRKELAKEIKDQIITLSKTMKRQEVADQLGLGVATVYRVLKSVNP